MEVAEMLDLREGERAAGEETSFEEQETNGDALEGAERAREEKRAARTSAPIGIWFCSRE